MFAGSGRRRCGNEVEIWSSGMVRGAELSMFRCDTPNYSDEIWGNGQTLRVGTPGPYRRTRCGWGTFRSP